MTVPEAHYCVILILWDESDKSCHAGEGSNLQGMGGVDQSIQNCQEGVLYFLEFSNTLLLETSHLRAGVYHRLSYSKNSWLWKIKLFYSSLHHRIFLIDPAAVTDFVWPVTTFRFPIGVEALNDTGIAIHWPARGAHGCVDGEGSHATAVSENVKAWDRLYS